MEKYYVGIAGDTTQFEAFFTALTAGKEMLLTSFADAARPHEIMIAVINQRLRASRLPAKKNAAMQPNRFLVVLLSAALWVAISGCALRPNYAIKFESKNSETNIVVHLAPRMPEALGGEEDVYVQRITPHGKSRKFKIDHNGRFSRLVKVDSGNGGTWARIYLELDLPMVGESVSYGTNASGGARRVFKDYRTGQTTVSNCHPYNVIALVNFESGFVMNNYRVNRTAAEWNARLIGLVETLPSVQILRGDTVTWQQTVRSDRKE